MMQKIGGILIALLILWVLTSMSGANNRNIQMETAGAGEAASSFAKSCQRSMKRYSAVFHQGAPYYVTGCICIGVKMQNSGVLTNENVDVYKSVYKQFVKQNRSQMRTNLPGNQSPKLSLAQSEIPAERAIASSILSNYKYCDTYDLQGKRRINQEVYKRMTQR